LRGTNELIEFFMCGIAGKFNYTGARPVEPGLIQRMTNLMVHRGPDAEGHYVDDHVALGHRRLSILDLSEAGRQPMCNEDGTIWIVFNGEIYNFKELRSRLISRGHVFNSHTDTETIIHLYEEEGASCVDSLRGMFAFAIWDSRRKTLTVARDRVGIKPLYYRDDGRSFAFASEMKALLGPSFEGTEVDLPAIDRLLTHRFLPGEGTMVKGIAKLKPAHVLTVDDAGVRMRQFWDLRYGGRGREISMDRAAQEFDSLLCQVTGEHMMSDVPVGFLASGGVDSTALLSYASTQTPHQISTFTVGFSGEAFADERPYARLASVRFGTQHYETTISSEDFRDFLSDYVWHMEEPVCEPPAIALYYVSRLASRHVKVLLSGEGGDEAFGGYPEYRTILWLERLKRLPALLRGPIGRMAGALSRFERYSRLRRYLPLLSMPLSEYYFSRISSPTTKHNPLKESLYTPDFAGAVRNGVGVEYACKIFPRDIDGSCVNQMLYVDTKTWLPDDLLIKADKITMANSVELRVPFLDHKVLEFAAALPDRLKVNGFSSKRVLKHAFRKRIPREILNRKKTGFPVPFAGWLRGELREFVADILTSAKAAGRGYFRKDAVERLLQAEGHNCASEIFTLLALELWHQRFIDDFDSAQASSPSSVQRGNGVQVISR
jgi:asparagine synthase (glutamine-hydrolysing)